MLISEAYRELNAQMHAEVAAYGTSGHSSADNVKRLAEIVKAKSILDYGCGKRTLEQALGFPISNYDPGIVELASPPSPADVVVCSDVLEHIESHCLDAVLDDLKRLALDTVYLVVATGPALKHYPDGRNTHLIQQPFEWWKEKLEKRFCTARYWGTEGGFIWIGRALDKQFQTLDLASLGPTSSTKEIKVKSVYTEEQRCVNIRSSMLRGLPSVVTLPPNDKIMILACYGPSLTDTLRHLKLEKGDVYSVSGAHDALLRYGVVPAGHIESDPRPHKAKLIRKPHADVCYMLASACHRDMFQNLEGYERWLFHVTSSVEESSLIASMERQQSAFTVDGGTNVGMSAVGLGRALGYRRFSVHGMDCSFKADEDILNWPRDRDMRPDMRKHVYCHAGDHPNEDQMLCRVWVGDRPFITSPQMLQGAQDFLIMFRNNPQCRFQLHGDGYLKALFLYLSKANQHRRVA